MLRSGNRIGPYTLIRQIGSGGFGVVWLAEQHTSMVTMNVAIKVLPMEADLEIIKNEATLWIQLGGHPNIAPIIETNTYEEQIVIVSEYIPDGSLENWLRQYGGAAPPIQSAIEMASGILAGLEYLHGQHIIHRDLKPSNILIQGGTPRIIDFGLARLLGADNRQNLVEGTPAYMAPEAFRGRRSEQTDVWSVGVIFYQLMAGNLPFPPGDDFSIVGAILSDDPNPLPASVPTPLRDIIARSLNKDPLQRYRSAKEMREALRQAMELIKPEKSAETQKRRTTVLLTYSASDKETAKSITDQLARMNITIQFDQYELQSGDSISKAIRPALLPGGYIVVLLSRDSVNSHWLKEELVTDLLPEFSHRNITLLLVLIDSCQIPMPLADYQFLNIQAEDGIEKLIKAIDKMSEIEFEKLSSQSFEALVSDLLLRIGFRQSQITQNDYQFPSTADYWLLNSFELGTKETYLVEAKLYRQSRADLKSVRQLAEYLKRIPSLKKGILVTNSKLTSVATEWLQQVEEKEQVQIRIIDGTELKRLLLQNIDLIPKYFSISEEVKY